MYAQVIVDIAVEEVDRVFTYRVPQGMTVGPGYRVSVPFGPRMKEGYVLKLTQDAAIEESRIKDIQSTLEDYPALLPQLIDLAMEISAQTHCPLCEALRLMLPSQMRGARVRVRMEQMAKALVSADAVNEYTQKLSKQAVKKRTLLRILGDGAAHCVEDLKAMVNAPLQPLKELEKDGIIRLFEREKLRGPWYGTSSAVQDPVLMEQQQETLDELLAAFEKAGSVSSDERRGNVSVARQFQFLLYGVTGSGKTEVYIRLVRECLKKGRGAIVLVPEIALTPQMVDWFRARFGDQAAVLHSRLSAGERYDEWRRIRRGDARLVIGARSAVFAPIENLGAVIVDEEHEQSYQAENFPQYDAREIGKLRACNEGAVLLLASATPSIYSFALARRGDYTLLEMPKRVNGRPLPQVTVVDMRREFRLGNRGIFSSVLQSRLKECIGAGQQAMLFINRRGYSPSVSCRACGHVLKCPQCDVSMAYHRSDDRMHCHYCGTTMPLPQRCPECGSESIRTIGTGTQRVEEELKKLFPGVKTIRMDMDTTQTKNAHYELINAFRAREAQVLIGTQMIAKGLDFPQVTLVGAILADLSLNMPDYRSPERTFQLLVQVAGRAGRANMPGEVVIQSYKPEHYAIREAAAQDYRAFFEEEFSYRRAHLFPPFTIIARCLCEAADAKTALDAANTLMAQAKNWLDARPQLRKRLLFIRADEAPIAYIQGRCRAQVLIKLLNHPDSDEIILAFQEIVRAPLNNGARACLEINPASLA